MKNIKLLSVSIVLTLMACGGQNGKNDSGADTTMQTADSVAQETQIEIEEAGKEEPINDASVLNADLLGSWSNNNDPVIEMKVSDKFGKYDDYKGYGYVKAANEYFEYDFTLVFTSLTPEGESVRVRYDKLEQQYTGDPDNPDSEGEWIMKKVGSGELTLLPAGAHKLKIDSREKRIKNVTLYK